MDYQSQTAEQELTKLFHDFLDAGLQGRFEEALALMAEPYTGIGMGEQGFIRGKEEAKQVLCDSYLPVAGSVIDYEVRNFTVNMLSKDVAVISGEVIVSNTPPDGETMYSGLMQTVGARCDDKCWRIAFTHSSPTVLTAKSVDAYPLRFMGNTVCELKADLQANFTMQTDPLTGILNRDGLECRAAEIIDNYNPKYNTALFMIDLDDFKQINDRLGHQTGDAVLKQVALTLRSTFRDVDAVARIGGDEFMVLLAGDFSVKFLEKKAQELLHSMQLHTGDDKHIRISVSIGIAYGKTRSTFEELYKMADIALYSAKRAGKCCYYLINFDTNIQHGHSIPGNNLMSLQTLLDYTNGKNLAPHKTPYEALLENIPGCVVMIEFTDTQVKSTHCNEWFNRLLGYTEEELKELQKESSMAICHPDDMDYIKAAVQSIRDGDDSNSIVYRVRHKDGSYTHIAQSVTVISRKPGSIIMYGIETDVEETYRLKQEVEDSKKELEAFVNAIPGGVLSICLTDRIRLVHRNNWVCSFLGYSQSEIDKLEHGNAFALVHPDDITLFDKTIEQMRSEIKVTSIIYRLLAKDGTYRHVRISLSFIGRCDEEIIYYGVVTDVEQMTKVQSELEYANRKLEALLSAIPGGIAIFEIGNVVKVKQYGTWFGNFSGYTAKEELEKIHSENGLELVWHDDVAKTQEAFLRVVEKGADRLFLSIRVKCKDGTPKFVDMHGSVIERTADKIIMYVVYIDPSERE